MLQGVGKKIVPQAAVGDLNAQILWLKEVRMPEGRLANVDRVLRDIADPAARACARNRKLSGRHGGILRPHMIEYGFHTAARDKTIPVEVGRNNASCGNDPPEIQIIEVWIV